MRNLLFLREYGVFLFTLLSASGCHSGKSALNSSTNADDSSACPSGKAIVSLTYDDGLPSQIANALPALDASDFRGTFFLNDISANPAPWKDAKKAGHELGSHTVHHPCTETFDWVQKENASEAYTEQRMADELRAQVELLRSLGQKSPLSFAYPCGTTWIGEAHKSYVPLIRMRFAAARGVEGQIYTHIEDPMNIGAYFIEGPKETLIE